MKNRFLQDAPALLIGVSARRLTQLAAGLINSGIRIEVATIEEAHADRRRPGRTFELVILDAVDDARGDTGSIARELRQTYDAPIVVLARRALRERIAGVGVVAVGVGVDGSLLAPHSVTMAIARAARDLRPIGRADGIQVHREAPRVMHSGQWSDVDPLQAALLRVLLASPGTSHSFESLCRAIGRPEAVRDCRSGNAVRRALARANATVAHARLRIVASDDLGIALVLPD